MQITKVTLYVVDHDLMGEFEIKEVIENTKYPNWCISPHVLSVESRSVKWDDGCDFNKTDKCEAAVKELFNQPLER